jgi:hypothetical protein
MGKNKMDEMRPSNSQRQELTSRTLTFEQWYARLKGFNAIPGAARPEPMTPPVAGRFESRTKAA